MSCNTSLWIRAARRKAPSILAWCISQDALRVCAMRPGAPSCCVAPVARACCLLSALASAVADSGLDLPSHHSSVSEAYGKVEQDAGADPAGMPTGADPAGMPTSLMLLIVPAIFTAVALMLTWLIAMLWWSSNRTHLRTASPERWTCGPAPLLRRRRSTAAERGASSSSPEANGDARARGLGDGAEHSGREGLVLNWALAAARWEVRAESTPEPPGRDDSRARPADIFEILGANEEASEMLRLVLERCERKPFWNARMACRLWWQLALDVEEQREKACFSTYEHGLYQTYVRQPRALRDFRGPCHTRPGALSWNALQRARSCEPPLEPVDSADPRTFKASYGRPSAGGGAGAPQDLISTSLFAAACSTTGRNVYVWDGEGPGAIGARFQFRHCQFTLEHETTVAHVAMRGRVVATVTVSGRVSVAQGMAQTGRAQHGQLHLWDLANPAERGCRGEVVRRRERPTDARPCSAHTTHLVWASTSPLSALLTVVCMTPEALPDSTGLRPYLCSSLVGNDGLFAGRTEQRLHVEREVCCLAVSGTLAVGGTPQGDICVWVVRTQPRKRGGVKAPAARAAPGAAICLDPLASLPGHAGRVSSVAFDATPGRFVSGSSDGVVRVWTAAHDHGTWRCVAELTHGLVPSSGPRASPMATRASPPAHCVHLTCLAVKGRLVVSGDSAGCVRVWEAARGMDVQLAMPSSHPDPIAARGVLVDGGRILVGFADGELREWLSDMHDWRWRTCPHL